MFGRLVTALLVLFLVNPLFADDGRQVIDRMTRKLRGQTNIAEYEMTVHRPRWTRSVRLKVWDDRKGERLFIRILEPPKDRGVSFLKIGYNLWQYLPAVEKVMKIPPSMMLQPWMGSDFSNDDLVKESSYVDDYDHQIVGKESREGISLLKIELIPHPHAPVVWGKVIYWVREKDDLPVEQHFIDERGRVVKKLTFSEFKVMDETLQPSLWEMNNLVKEDQKTTIHLLSVDFDPSPPIPASVFTERNLRP